MKTTEIEKRLYQMEGLMMAQQIVAKFQSFHYDYNDLKNCLTILNLIDKKWNELYNLNKKELK